MTSVLDAPHLPAVQTPPNRTPSVRAPAGETKRDLRGRTEDDTLSLLGSALASLLLAYVLYDMLLPTQGKIGFVLLWFALFMVLYGVVTSMSNPRPVVVDRLASTVIQAGAGLVGLALASAVIYTFAKGHTAFLHVNFYTHDMSGVGPQDPLNRGGIKHAIVGSLIEIGLAVLVALPLGLGTAVYMTEIGGPVARVIKTVVEAMTALPSIVAGLFIYSTAIVEFHVPRSGFAASLAIMVMILPIIARSADVVLRVVPGGLRQAGLALGAPLWRVVWHVVLPTARSGLATALILGIARGIGETSPVLLTSGASTFFNKNPFSEPMNSLPLFVYSSVRSGEPVYIARGFGAASVLLALVLFLFLITRLLARGRASR